jgi:hypothetical protein
MLVPVEPIKIDIPHESGQWIEFRKLSWKQLRDARKARANEQREEAKALGAEFINALGSGSSDDEERLKKRLEALQYDISNFDMEVLLTKGVAATSYRLPDGNPVDVQIAIAQFDEATALWAAKTLVDMAKPPTASEEKKG